MDNIHMYEKLILLDRDGVINKDRADYVKNISELEILDYVLEAFSYLNERGVAVGICTNQAGISRGLYTEQRLEEIHTYLKSVLATVYKQSIWIEYCSELNEDNFYRKPNPGMLLKQLDFFGKNGRDVYYVGDDYKDILAARNAKCIPVLVLTGKGRLTQQKYADQLKNVLIFENLLSAVKSLY